MNVDKLLRNESVLLEADILYKGESPIFSNALIKDDVVVFADLEGMITAVSRCEKSLIWQTYVKRAVRSELLEEGEFLYVNAGNHLLKLDFLTGEILWEYKHEVEAVKSDLWDYHNSSPVIYKERVYYGTTDGWLLGIRKDIGLVEIKISPLGDGDDRLLTAPQIVDDTLYIGSFKGHVYMIDLNTQIARVLYDTGQPVYYSLVLEGDYLYFAGRSTYIYCIDRHRGEEIWVTQDRLTTSWITGGPVLYNNYLIIASSDSKTLYTLNKFTGDILRMNKLDTNSFVTPLIYGDMVIVCNGDAYVEGIGDISVFGLNKEDISPIASLDMGSNLFGTPTLVGNQVYLGTSSGYVYQVTINRL